MSLQPVNVLNNATRNVICPKHGEVRVNHFAGCRQIEPDLKQLQRVGLNGIEQRKHLSMHDALARSEPLHIALPKAGGCTQ